MKNKQLTFLLKLVLHHLLENKLYCYEIIYFI